MWSMYCSYGTKKKFKVFLDCMNQQHKNKTFTLEMEENKLNFLDL